jgi:copper(I)-binding protein
MRAVFAAALAVSAVLAPAAWAKAKARHGVEVRYVWIQTPPNGAATSAAYVDVVNTGKTEDRLIGASCACAGMAMVHEMSVANGVMHMGEAKGGLPIPAGGELTLEPGGSHLMLMDLKSKLTSGAQVKLTLEFAHAGKVTATAVVMSKNPAAIKMY